eukprot:3299611-Karenia_brevis.AAC.2
MDAQPWQGYPRSRGKSPYTGNKANKAKGLSHSGKGPATGIGQPYVTCQHQLDNKCPGWACQHQLDGQPWKHSHLIRIAHVAPPLSSPGKQENTGKGIVHSGVY